MSIKVVRYDSNTGCEIKTIGDGFASTDEANSFRHSMPREIGTFTKMEKSDAPIRQSSANHFEYIENPRARESVSSSNRPRVFIEGWIVVLILIAGIIFFLLKLA